MEVVLQSIVYLHSFWELQCYHLVLDYNCGVISSFSCFLKSDLLICKTENMAAHCRTRTVFVHEWTSSTRDKHSSPRQTLDSDLLWRWKVYAHVQVLNTVCMSVCESLLMRASLTGPWCQLMSVSVSVNVKDAVVIHPDHGGMTLFVTVVMDSASLRGACASGVSERLSLCFTLTHSHTRTHTHTQRTAGADNKGVLIQLWGNKIRLQRNS